MHHNRTSHPSLKASLLAICIVGSAIAGLPALAQLLAGKGTGILLIQPSPHKDMGVVLQRSGFRDARILPMYGSSEMSFSDFPNRPDIAFANAPSGFQVSPFGKGGCTSLIIAERLAATGDVMAGKKVVIMVSPTWFRRRGVIPEQYTGNFSELQATLLATNASLSYDLRHRFAIRMLAQRQTLEERKALSKALWRMREAEEKGALSRWVKSIGLQLHGARLLLEDHALTFADWLDAYKGASPLPANVGTAAPGTLACELGTSPASFIGVPPRPVIEKTWLLDDYFATLMANANEWEDFEILLETLKELRAKPLIIAMPMDGVEMETLGISYEARNKLYYKRMEAMCQARGFAFDYLPEQEHNPEFLYKQKSHLSNVGWTYVNLLLDRFFHDLPLRPAQPPVLASTVGTVTVPAKPQPLASPSPADPLVGTKAGEERAFSLPGGGKMVFCYCPAGDFTMGSPANEADREADENAVKVSLTHGFWLAKTECSQGQWRAIAPLPTTQFKGDELPVEQLADFEATKFLATLTQGLHLPPGWVATLPTEAQWEWACRAGGSTPYHFGKRLTQQQATFNAAVADEGDEEEPSGKSSPVGEHKANAWGLVDMHGNVFEYCADWYSPVLMGGPDPQGPASGTQRVVRGGCWHSFAPRCRSAYRGFCLTNYPYRGVGVRPALVFVGGKN